MMRQASLQGSSRKTSPLVSRYGTAETFLTTFNPDCQQVVCRSADECFFGDYPTLTETRIAYGDNVPVAWMIPQLYDLSEYCGCRDKLYGKPLEQCAFVIATEFHYLKVTELMLFFHRFKTGRYGRFYGSVDPLVITTALREFINERGIAYEHHEQQERERKEREDAKRSTSWEDFCMMEYGEIRPHPLSRL